MVTASCVVVAIELSPSVGGELGDRIRAVILPCRLAACHQLAQKMVAFCWTVLVVGAKGTPRLYSFHY